MESFLFFVFLLLVLYAIVSNVIGGIALRFSPHGQARVYESVVRRFGGTFQSGGLLRRGIVRFQYGQTWVTVTAGSRHGNRRSTQVTLQWPDGRMDWRLASRTHDEPLDSERDPQEIPSGDLAFDQRYRVTGRHDDDARRLLSDGVRWQVNKLSQSPHPSPIRISIRHGRLIVEKLLHIQRAEELQLFAQQCLDLYDQAMLTRSEGIEFVGGSEEAVPVGNPICKVCGEPIVHDMVFCRRCCTPHHLDCWQYNGLCSTYGCRETRFKIPKVARPVRDPDEDESSHRPQRPR